MAAARESQRLRRASRGRGEAEEDNGRREDDDARGEDNAQGEEGNLPFEDSGGGVFSTLKDTVADAALAVLKPVAKRGATKAAQFAVEKGPELFEDKVLPLMEESGGPMGLVSKVAGGDGAMGGMLSKLTGGGDDEDGDRDAGDGTGQGRRMPIQQAVDVAAPIDIVYDQFTQFEDWPKFMHRLESAQQKDEATVVFNEKIWIIRRSWEAEIIEQRPDERIVWESVSGMQHVGVVTFHELAERLTRVEVNVDIDPSGPMEKIARGARFAKRAVRADLHRFKAFVEMHEEETGEWRGEIQDGEVVGYEDEEEYEDEGYEDEEESEEPQAEEEAEEPEAEYEDEEPEAEYEDEDEPEDAVAEDEDEDEEEQPRTRTRRRSSTRSSSNGSSKSESAKPKRSRAKASSSGSGSSSRSRSRGGSKSGSGSKTSKAKSSNAKSSASKSSTASKRSSSGSRSRGGSSSAKSKSSSSRSRGSSAKSKGRSSGGKSRAKASSSKS